MKVSQLTASAIALSLLAASACSDDDDRAPTLTTPGVDGGTVDSSTPGSVDAGNDADATVDAGPVAFSCTGKNGPTLSFVPGQEQAVLDAVNQLAECTTVMLGAGTFTFNNALTIRQKGITIRGAGKGVKAGVVGTATSTVLDFTGAVTNTNGVDQQGDLFAITDLAIINAKKDALRVEQSTNVKIQKVRTEWAVENLATNGKYGIYPVKSTNVLVEDCEAYNASDAGIYVGQTTNAILRKNVAKQNVAGIEIENTRNADVSENTAEDNTCGLVVFDLPGNPIAGTDVKLLKNTVQNNNRPNFGAGIVGTVPAGTGTFIMASRRVELTENTYANNNTVDIGIISGLSIEPDVTKWAAGGNNWGVKDLWVHANTFQTGSGDMVDNGVPNATLRPLGALLAGLYGYAALASLATRIEPVLWDGVDPNPLADNFDNGVNLCVTSNTLPAALTNTVVDINLGVITPLLTATVPNAPAAWLKTSHKPQGDAPFNCTGFTPALAAVVLP